MLKCLTRTHVMRVVEAGNQRRHETLDDIVADWKRRMDAAVVPGGGPPPPQLRQ